MRHLFISFVFVLLASIFAMAESSEIIKSESKLMWEGRKVTGKHFGNIYFQDGNVTISNDVITGGVFVVDMKTMDCEDIKDEKWNKKLIDHFYSDDFFSIAKFPNSKMVITSVEPKGNMRYTYKVDLTIKDITHEQVFDAILTKENGKLKATGKMVVDRTKYGIKYGSGSFFDNLGDKTISDEFSIEFIVVAPNKK